MRFVLWRYFVIAGYAQTITLAPIASPVVGTVNLSAAISGERSTVSYVEYQLNRRRLPASVSTSRAGQSYTVAWNTAENLWNGEHKVRAVARDLMGAELASSAEQAVVVQNGTDTIKVTPSTAFTAPWSGTVTFKVQVTAADKQDSYCSLYVDGVYLRNEWGTSANANVCTLTLDTKTLENGRRRIFISAQGVNNNWARGMVEHDVTVANAAANAVSLEAGASELWLTPGGTAQLRPRVRRADSTTEDVASGAAYASAGLKIAAVNSSGLVTGVAVGDTDITVTARGLSRTVRVSVNATNTMPHFGRDGTILEAYDARKSFIPRSWFFSGRSNIEGGGVSAYKAGWANCWEEGVFLAPASGEVQRAWQGRVNAHWEALASFAGSSGLCLVGTGDDLARTSEALYKSTRGEWPQWAPNTVTYGFTKARDARFVVGIHVVDEVSYSWGWNPFLDGVIGGAFKQIKAAGKVCTVTWPGWSMNGARAFVISGGRTPGFNTAAGTVRQISAQIDTSTFQFSCPEVANGTYTAATDPGMTLEMIAALWFGNDYNRNNAFTALMMAANAVPGRPAIAWPVPANAGVEARRNWADRRLSDFGSVFWAAKARRYPTGQAVNDMIGDMLAVYRENYGVARRDRPWVGLAPAGGSMYKVAGVPRAIASIGGGAVRFQAPHGLTAIKPNVTRMTVSGNAGVNGNMYIAGIRNANELYIAAQKSPYSGEGFGGTVTFEDSTVWPLISIAADQSGAILQVQTTCAAPASAKLYQRFRVAGSTNAQLNRDWWFSIPSTNPACNWMQNAKPMVTASGAGGTGYLITTNAYIAGVSPLMVQGVSPAAAFAGYAWAVIQGATGVRAYGLSNLDPDQDARASGFFHMEPASGDGLNYNASPKFTASGMKDRWSAMTAAAEWVAAHEAYLLQPREASPDYGSQFVTTVRSGPAGRLLVVMNTTDGYIQRAVALPGGQVTRRRMTERGAVVSAIAGAADVVTFGPNEVIAYLSVQ